ncbi:hypothetical protein CWI75_10340 [Kineobactrum sediminis]|uniref:Alginate export domain-containing protein n=1 Tax=Kineobactrum sediminis TaxID=1905677 RepID=A0A2N5Y1A7_9GAMM|nr:hypothetical protein [Kineobactrum sediminis]PLW82178.1 hypothetical protein CWI75_10340 [Kineobactrum sediminis]
MSLRATAVEGMPDPDIHGHVKYRYLTARYPEHSIYHHWYGETSSDHLLDSRFKFSFREGRFDLQVDYQIQALHSDLLRTRQVTGSPQPGQAYPEDDRRFVDLTKVVSEGRDTAILHRLDRFNIGYSSDQLVLRAGRQVLSWGNGLMFNPVDFFNPFDPVALDTEYKVGDDMLYGQYLFADGDDIQAVAVGRRNSRDSVTADESSFVVKYHGWLDDRVAWVGLAGAELDLLAGVHFEQTILAAGLVKSMGGAIWRGDLMFTDTDEGGVLSAVANLSYSWTWGETNISGTAEYYHNGFGLDDGRYRLPRVLRDDALQARLGRGELFTLGRNYLGLAATIELTPLWLLTPTFLVNLDDQSALLQLGSRHDLAQDWHLIAALNLPLGPKGSEYGGIKSGFRDTTLASEGGLFVQLAYYF